MRDQAGIGHDNRNCVALTCFTTRLDKPSPDRQHELAFSLAPEANSPLPLGITPLMNTIDLNYRSLPISERIELVEDIWDSIAEETANSLPLTDEERAELDRRYAAHLADPTNSVPWEQVRQELFQGLH